MRGRGDPALRTRLGLSVLGELFSDAEARGNSVVSCVLASHVRSAASRAAPGALARVKARRGSRDEGLAPVPAAVGGSDRNFPGAAGRVPDRNPSLGVRAA
jgi:hypothetical protein